MTESERNYIKFEQGLHCNSDDTAIDYLAVESRLFERIQASDGLGVLSTLKADIIPLSEFFETIEKDLTEKIKNYREYDEPVDECIRYNEDLSQPQWERLEHKLDEKMKSVQDLPAWETLIKAPAVEPVSSQWESIEQNLFTQINHAESKDFWELCTKTDEVEIPGDAEHLELQLQRRLEQTVHLSWEQVVKSDEILSFKKWEEYEEKLFSRIGQSSDISKQPFWFILEQFVNTFKTAGVITALLIFVVLGISGFFYANREPAEIPSVVYQMQGEAALRSDLAGIQNGSFSSVPGGNVTIVNDHGSVALQDESKVELQKISRKGAHYKVDFSKTTVSGAKPVGNVAFFVNKNSGRNEFKVETVDYNIFVKGTYFRVEPDVYGRVSTRVLEGVVKIHSGEFGDTLLYAGQSIVFDINSNRYTIHASGPVMSRDEIGQTPATDELLSYRSVSIKTNSAQSEVFIDGTLHGYAPLTILQPAGIHRVIVKKTGYSGIDTLINLVVDQDIALLDLQLEKIETILTASEENIASAVTSGSENNIPKKQAVDLSPDMVAEKLLGVDPGVLTVATEKYYAAQKFETAGDWRSAVVLYQEVFDSHGSSKLRKEDALFSIGKIRAEHESDVTEAKQVFLKYLALFPNGSFSGESWLRLAELEFNNKPENSVQYYNKFFEMFPRHPRLPELQNRVGVIYLQSKRFMDAITMFKRALSASGSTNPGERKQICSNLYRALEESGDTEAAAVLKKEQLAESK